MSVKRQLTTEELIKSFKETEHNEINLHSNPPILEVMNTLNNMNINTNEDYSKAKIYSRYIEENTVKRESFYWPYTESPFFIDEEIEQLRDYYAESGNESYHDYFDESSYPAYHTSNNRDNTSKSWNSRIMQLQNQLDMEEDPQEKDKIKQNLVDLGWNPEIEYNQESQIMARNRFVNLMTERMCNTEIIDIQSLIENYNENDYITESKSDNMHPVSIVLVQYKTGGGPIISMVTNSDFTHAAIALDGDFNRLYSFNMNNEINLAGGFSLESIGDYEKDGRLAVYTFFIKNKDYDTLSSRIQELLLNIKNTVYSFANILLFPFKKIRLNNNNSMICSQFVDSCMKMINIDITNEPSSKVSPAKLYDSSVKNAKIYKTYDGFVRDFDFLKAKSFINRLSKSASLIKESNNMINNYISPVIVEARKVPIEINDDGDVLLTNPFPDFDAEYMNSHKLLMQYYKAGNIEPMKYELARLYYMNYILEKKIYHNKFLSNKEKNIKTRARVLNDFNKYIKVVLKAQPEFNFGEYYEKSPFYPHTVEIKKSTISKLKDLKNYILIQ